MDDFCSSYNCFQNYEMLLKLKLIVRLKLIKEAMPHFFSEKKREYMTVVARHAKEMIKKFQLRSSRSDKLIRQSRKSAREALAIAKRKTLLIRNPRKLAVRRAASHTASNAAAGFQSTYRPKGTPRSPFKSSHTKVSLSHNRSIEVLPSKDPSEAQYDR